MATAGPRAAAVGEKHTDFSDRVRQLLQRHGPCRLCGVSFAYDELYGSGTWNAERPVRSAAKACALPYVADVTVVDGWVHLVEAAAQGEEGAARREEAAAQADFATAGSSSVQVRLFVSAECAAIASEQVISIKFARSPAFWRCTLACRPTLRPAQERQEGSVRSDLLPSAEVAAPRLAADTDDIREMGYGPVHEDCPDGARSRTYSSDCHHCLIRCRCCSTFGRRSNVRWVGRFVGRNFTRDRQSFDRESWRKSDAVE